MKVLVTGANGFLGQYLCKSLANKGFEVIGISRGDCKITDLQTIKYQSVDVTKKEEITRIINDIKPDIIIHNAAMSKPDACNNDKPECLLQNVEATKFLVGASEKIGSYFIYISTDFVFGENGPHDENALPAPLNFYGESKLMAEKIVVASRLKSAIMRPVFIYGEVKNGMRSNFLYWVKTNLENNTAIKVVTDQQRTPTFVNDICDGIIAMIENRVTGEFHLAGKDILSPYDMAVTVAKTLSLNASLIEPVTSETFIEPVLRAKHSGLKIDKAIAVLGYSPVSFEEGVRLSFGL